MNASPEPQAWTLRRRPFLAPLWLGALAFVMLLAAAIVLYQSATTTVIVIVRAAEAVQGGIADPPLAPEGEERAQRLAHLFGGAGGAPLGSAGRLAAIYSLPERRATQTVEPLAALLRLPLNVTDAQPPEALAARVLREQRGHVALLVGDAAVVREWLAALGIEAQGAAIPRDDDYGRIEVISIPTLGSGRLLQLQY